MISYKKARKLLEKETKVLKSLKEVEVDLKTQLERGICNPFLDVHTSIAGTVIKELQKSGYTKIFCDLNGHKNVTVINVEV